MNPYSSLANQSSPEGQNDESGPGAFPSPASHHTRFSRSSTLAGSLAGSRKQSISSSSHLISPGSPGFPFPRQESKSDKSSLLRHERAADARRGSRRKQWFKGWWLCEMGGCALSVCCTIVIVVLLPYLDDKPLSQWHWVMGPNTFISTLITITKSSMLLPVAECLSQLKWRHFWLQSHPLAEIEAFDEASRGPWGAMLFAWRTKFKSRIALMGAFVMIGALAMEPLAQQIVQFETRYQRPPLDDLRAEERSSIVVAQAYNLQTPIGFEKEPFMVAQDLQAAFFDGVFNVPRQISSSCPHGNCTWPDFLSLGVCSSCKDVTETERFQDFPCESPASETCVYRNYSAIGDEFRLDGHPFVAVMGNETNILAQSASNYANDLNHSTPEWHNTVDEGSIADIALGRFGQYLTERDGHPDVVNAMPELTRCSIHWCAQLYQDLSYQNTTIQGTTAHQYTKLDLPLQRQTASSPATDTDPSTIVYAIDYPLTALTYPNLTARDLDTIYDRTFANAANSPRTFRVGQNAYRTTSHFIGAMLTFTLASAPPDPQAATTKPEQQIVSRALLRSRNVTVTINGVAQSVSAAVRESVDARRRGSRFTVAGQASVAETMVRIRKRWFAVPAALVVVAGAFLGATVVANEAPGWKSGELALLFHGLEGWGEFGDGEGVELMRARARGMRARLKGNTEGVVKFMKV